MVGGVISNTQKEAHYMQLTQYVIDAFSRNLFGGNPAAVVVLEDFLSDELMQQIAAENNLSETAFLVPKGESHHIRWFSPLSEIEFCGHASLASAYVLHHFYQMPAHLTLYCRLLGDFDIHIAQDGLISMTFPNRAPQAIDVVPEALYQGLSVKPCQVLRSAQAYFAIYDDEHTLRSIQMDAAPLKTLAPFDVVVTAPSAQEGVDFVSRYFWPANGGDEDPVTGSIHAGLFPYWGERLNRHNLCAKQVSAREGTLYGQLQGEQVVVSGYACVYAQTQLYLPD